MRDGLCRLGKPPRCDTGAHDQSHHGAAATYVTTILCRRNSPSTVRMKLGCGILFNTRSPRITWWYYSGSTMAIIYLSYTVIVLFLLSLLLELEMPQLFLGSKKGEQSRQSGLKVIRWSKRARSSMDTQGGLKSSTGPMQKNQERPVYDLQEINANGIAPGPT